MEPKKQMKLKNKEQPTKQPEQPKLDPNKLRDRLTACREKFQRVFVEFHKLFANKKLETNKNAQEKEAERKLADEMFGAAADLDNANPGEGVMIVASIAIRELLKMRDRVNELEYKLLLTRKEMAERNEKAQ